MGFFSSAWFRVRAGSAGSECCCVSVEQVASDLYSPNHREDTSDAQVASVWLGVGSYPAKLVCVGLQSGQKSLCTRLSFLGFRPYRAAGTSSQSDAVSQALHLRGIAQRSERGEGHTAFQCSGAISSTDQEESGKYTPRALLLLRYNCTAAVPTRPTFLNIKQCCVALPLLAAPLCPWPPSTSSPSAASEASAMNGSRYEGGHGGRSHCSWGVPGSREF